MNDGEATDDYEMKIINLTWVKTNFDKNVLQF